MWSASFVWKLNQNDLWIELNIFQGSILLVSSFYLAGERTNERFLTVVNIDTAGGRSAGQVLFDVHKRDVIAKVNRNRRRRRRACAPPATRTRISLYLELRLPAAWRRIFLRRRDASSYSSGSSMGKRFIVLLPISWSPFIFRFLSLRRVVSRGRTRWKMDSGKIYTFKESNSSAVPFTVTVATCYDS